VGARGEQFPGQRITAGVAEGLWRRRKTPTMSEVLFSPTVHLLPKDLKFEEGVPKLLLAPGVIKHRYAYAVYVSDGMRMTGFKISFK